MKLLKFIPLFLILPLLLPGAHGQQLTDTYNFNLEWEYLEQGLNDTDAVKKASGWQKIDLPHTWNSKDATDLEPGYRRDIGWYKKSYSLNKVETDKDYILYFEGSNITTEVYVNDQLAGKHIGGYVGFNIEITSYLHSGENEILIKVDNGYNREIIPSQKSDFFIYGGITRDLWLKILPISRIEKVKVATPEVSKEKARTEVNVNTKGLINGGFRLQARLIDPAGQQVYQKKIKLKNINQVTFDFNLKNPKLWDVDNPQLYTLITELLKDNKVVHQKRENIGYRWFEFKEHGPFFLNGRRLLLRGTHRHEEHAGFGAALPNRLHRQDMQAIKDMGANFVRLGHYPQDPEVYKACDELGLLVWDELPWCRGGVGNEIWQKNTKKLLVEMIEQNYNHPSIIIWSLGNEIYWLPDFENGGDTVKINRFLKEINQLAHQMDPYRKTAIRKYYEGADIVDVFSPSIWSGWYSGSYKNYEQTINKAIEKYPKFLHMEYGGSSHVGRHNESPITGDGFKNPGAWEEPINQLKSVNVANNGDWSENYIVDLFDWYLAISETHPQLTGNAQWAFKDFGTPLRPENAIPYVNQKGLMDREGKPKDAYYVFKSYWSDDPFVYIESKSWQERSGPEDLIRNVCVFSNLERVDLYLNGKSLGTKNKDINKYPATGLNWDLNFKEGKNELVAIGYQNDQAIAHDTLQVQYWYSVNQTPRQLALSYQQLSNGNYLVTATALDKNQRRCLNFEDRIYFQCLSGGNTKKHLGTPTGSEVIEMANGQAAIEVAPNADAGKIVMMVINQNFKGTFLEIERKKGVNP